MFKIFVFCFSQTIFANNLNGRNIVKKIKQNICRCKEPKREIDLELFHEPYLRDSLQLFAKERFEPGLRYLEFAKIKIIFRIRF